MSDLQGAHVGVANRLRRNVGRLADNGTRRNLEAALKQMDGAGQDPESTKE